MSCGYVNGRFWADQNNIAKWAYLRGIQEGLAFAADAERTQKLWGGLADSTYGEILKGIDSFYENPANARIGVAEAVSVVKKQFEGQPVSDEWMMQLRRWYTGGCKLAQPNSGAATPERSVAQGGDWVKVTAQQEDGSVWSESVWYVTGTGGTRLDSGHLTAWVKVIGKNGNHLMQYEFSGDGRRTRMLQTERFDSTGKLIDSFKQPTAWTDVPDNSVIRKVYERTVRDTEARGQ